MAVLKKLSSPKDVVCIIDQYGLNLVAYKTVKSSYTFFYAEEEFFVTKLEGNFNVTHRRTGRGVIPSKSKKFPPNEQEAYNKAIKILDENCDKFGSIEKYPSIPDENLSLDLALKNLLLLWM